MAQRGAAAKASDRKEYNEAQELDNLSRVFARLNKKSDGKIDVDELWTHLKFLGYKCKRAECEDMIWEVDEDCDRCVNWEEFKTMFYRVRHDKSGWEPRRLFNVVEFMMHDKDMSGTIDMDECMEILFRRFGKELLESKGAKFESIELDTDPNGKALRARLGARTGRTSVPSVWIGGECVGGLNDGPGLVPLDADGELEPRLRSAGAMA